MFTQLKQTHPNFSNITIQPKCVERNFIMKATTAEANKATQAS